RARSASHPRQERFVTTDPRHSGLAIQGRVANPLPFAFVLDGRRGAARAGAKIRGLLCPGAGLRHGQDIRSSHHGAPDQNHRQPDRHDSNPNAITRNPHQPTSPAPAAYFMSRHKSRPALTLPPAPHITLSNSGRPDNANRSRSWPKNDQPRPAPWVAQEMRPAGSGRTAQPVPVAGTSHPLVISTRIIFGQTISPLRAPLPRYYPATSEHSTSAVMYHESTQA